MRGYAPMPDANTFPGPPRAEIPGAQGAPLGWSFGSAAAAAEELELSGAPERPVPQRLGFESGVAMNFPMPVGTAGADAAAVAASAIEGLPGTLPSAEDIADLKPLGQVSSSFIVAVNSEGLWIVDQHVAHERVLFEQHLRARREGDLGGQRLLVPIVVELNPRQLATFEQIGDELRANGFEADLMGGAQRRDSGRARGDCEQRRGKAALRNSRRHRAREPGNFDRFAAIEDRGVDVVPRGHQSEYAARQNENGMAARRARENRVSDELPARPAGRAALFGARHRARIQADLTMRRASSS